MTPLWPHQADAVDAVCRHFETDDRCTVVAACGTGKTRIGAEVSRRIAATGRVLVVVPTLELLTQTAAAYAAVMGAEAGAIGAVCSDHGATVESDQIRAELAHLHAGVTTDPDHVTALLARPGRVTVLCTYASLRVVATAHTVPGTPRWDLVVVDEAHRSAGRTDRAWHVIHDDTAIPVDRRLFMTATPRIINSQRYEATSMDDPKLFGPHVFHLPFAEAIESGLLADYRVLAAVVTDTEVAALTAQADAVVRAGGPAVPAAMLAAQIVLLKACREFDLRRVITYHHRVATAHRFASTLLNAAELLPDDQRPLQMRADAIDGAMSMAQRREILRHLHHPLHRTVVVSNARVLAEGVDVPELDAVMFADPRDSATDVVQAVGRALRRGHRMGKVATIVVPVLLRTGESAETALAGSAYNTVWRVVRALRAHDERLADWLDERRTRLTAKDPYTTSRGEHRLPDWLSVISTTVTPDFAAALRLRAIYATTDRWLDGYAAAAAFQAQHGHLKVPDGYLTSDGLALSRWLHRQRLVYRNEQMAPDRITRLEALGIVWNPNPSAWFKALERARAFHAEHGHLNIPYHYISPDGYKLGDWLSKQRKARNRLSQAQRHALDNLDITWSPAADAWAAAMQRLHEFHAEHGHANVPHDHRCVDGFQLGAWLKQQRIRRRRGQLDDERAAAIEKLGVSWEINSANWNKGLSRLSNYVHRHGHARVPTHYTDSDGYRLGKWVSRQRQLRSPSPRSKRRPLPASKIAALEQLGMVWSINKGEKDTD